jgi:hypothetical protein
MIEASDGRIDRKAVGAAPVIALASKLRECCQDGSWHAVEEVERASSRHAVSRDEIPDDLGDEPDRILGSVRDGRA